MIDANVLWERVSVLTEERETLAGNLQRGEAELERTRHLISAYDGAIGELRRVALMAGESEPAAVEPAQEA